MRGMQWQHQGVLTLLSGIILLFVVTNIKTLAQTPSTQSQCSEVEIKNYIQKLSYSQPSIYNALVACNYPAVTELVEALKNQDKELRIMTITALGEIASPSAVASLSNLLSDETRRDVRVAVIFALAQFANQGVPTLINALKDKDWYIRYQAANALGEIGSSAKEAIPALNDAVKNTDVNISFSAMTALEKIKKQEHCDGNQSFFEYPTGVSTEHNVQHDVKDSNNSTEIQFSAPNIRRTMTNNNKQSEIIYLGNGINPKPPADTFRLGSSIGPTKPPLMCRVPVLRVIFKWKCSR